MYILLPNTHNYDYITYIFICQTLVSRQVLQHLVYFFKQGDDEVQIKTVKGLGMSRLLHYQRAYSCTCRLPNSPI